MADEDRTEDEESHDSEETPTNTVLDVHDVYEGTTSQET